MDLPVPFPCKPMLAKAHDGIPAGDWLFEPKWDGFRCLVYRDGDEIELGSRNERPLTRYFPEMLDPLRAALPERCVVDGEIVVAIDDCLDFDALGQRIHPADSRVRMLAEKTPAAFVAFDVLAVGDRAVIDLPFAERRALLEESVTTGPQVHLTPITDERTVAEQWFRTVEGAGLDGLIAKDPAGVYEPDKRVLRKVKHQRTADCVAAGFRWHKDGNGIGSIILGIHGPDGDLRHVGVSASFTAKFRTELVDELEPLIEPDLANHPWGHWTDAAAHEEGQMPGPRAAGTTSGISRGSRSASSAWSRSATRP